MCQATGAAAVTTKANSRSLWLLDSRPRLHPPSQHGPLATALQTAVQHGRNSISCNCVPSPVSSDCGTPDGRQCQHRPHASPCAPCLCRSIPMLNPRRRALTSRLTQMGAHVATSMGDTHITHVVVHTDTLGAAAAGKSTQGTPACTMPCSACRVSVTTLARVTVASMDACDW